MAVRGERFWRALSDPVTNFENASLQNVNVFADLYVYTGKQVIAEAYMRPGQTTAHMVYFYIGAPIRCNQAVRAG